MDRAPLRIQVDTLNLSITRGLWCFCPCRKCRPGGASVEGSFCRGQLGTAEGNGSGRPTHQDGRTLPMGPGPLPGNVL